MNTGLQAKLNNMLAMAGLGRLDDPGLLSQLGFLVRDDEHLKQLLNAAEPDERRNMYEALRPHLRFDAKPLDVYLSETGDQADREQLPEWRDGQFHAHNVPDIHSAVQTLVEDAVATGFLTLVCKKCTREQSFSGLRKADAIFKAREAGWSYHEGNTEQRAYEVCPECP